jgi:hypothetical protein
VQSDTYEAAYEAVYVNSLGPENLLPSDGLKMTNVPQNTEY